MENDQKSNEIRVENSHTNHNLIIGLIVVVLALFGFGGYFVWQANQSVIEGYEEQVTELESDLVKEQQQFREFQIEIEAQAKKESWRTEEELKYPTLNWTSCAGIFGEGSCILVDTLSFTFNDLAGSVEYVCEPNSYFAAENLCAGNGFLQVTYDGQSEVIEQYTWADREEIFFSPQEVFFTEGFTHSTSSDGDSARLVLLVDPLNCRNIDGVCIRFLKSTHEINLPNLNVRSMPNFGLGFHPSSLVWNELGNKAVQQIPCPAGCPALQYKGINLDTGEETPLLWRNDDSQTPEIESPIEEDIFYAIDDIEWLDNNTVRIGDYEFSI